MLARFSVFRSNVRYYLINHYGWRSREVSEWFANHEDYLKAIHESAASSMETAVYIAEIKRKEKEKN